MSGVERAPVETIEELDSLDHGEVLEGYHDGFANEPCGGNRSKSFWHGWRNGQIDRGFLPSDHASAALAHAYVRRGQIAASPPSSPLKDEPAVTTSISKSPTESEVRSGAGNLEERRQAQPIEELERKMRKARRRDKWTQEDIDFGRAKARSVLSMLASPEPQNEAAPKTSITKALPRSIDETGD